MIAIRVVSVPQIRHRRVPHSGQVAVHRGGGCDTEEDRRRGAGWGDPDSYVAEQRAGDLYPIDVQIYFVAGDGIARRVNGGCR